jgi:hypothetical protein
VLLFCDATSRAKRHRQHCRTVKDTSDPGRRRESHSCGCWDRGRHSPLPLATLENM